MTIPRGEFQLVLPANATGVTIDAAGGKGGSGSAAPPGGFGAKLIGVPLSLPDAAPIGDDGSHTLYIDVAGNGTNADITRAGVNPGGYNGGGDGYSLAGAGAGGGGGGGGASTVQTAPGGTSCATSGNDCHLVVAGGGAGGLYSRGSGGGAISGGLAVWSGENAGVFGLRGGDGGRNGFTSFLFGIGGQGGNQDVAGGGGGGGESTNLVGGGGGTLPGGAGEETSTSAGRGVGGSVPADRPGAGGGGGWFGGGASQGGGGGAGSTYVRNRPQDATVSESRGRPEVVIRYTIPAVPPVVVTTAGLPP